MNGAQIKVNRMTQTGQDGHTYCMKLLNVYEARMKRNRSAHKYLLVNVVRS